MPRTGPVIEAVIVYEPDSGTIEVIGSVKKMRERLAKAFAETKLALPSRASVCRPGSSISRRCSIPGISWLSIPETALPALNTPC